MTILFWDVPLYFYFWRECWILNNLSCTQKLEKRKCFELSHKNICIEQVKEETHALSEVRKAIYFDYIKWYIWILDDTLSLKRNYFSTPTEQKYVIGVSAVEHDESLQEGRFKSEVSFRQLHLNHEDLKFFTAFFSLLLPNKGSSYK